MSVSCVTNDYMAHHTTSSVAPSPIDIAPVITSKISRDNFSVFDVMTGKMVRSGFAFAIDPDPVYKSKEATEHEVTIALGLARRDGASYMAICPRFDSSLDYVCVSLTERREEAIEATFSTGYSSYFNATTRRTDTIRHNFSDE